VALTAALALTVIALAPSRLITFQQLCYPLNNYYYTLFSRFVNTFCEINNNSDIIESDYNAIMSTLAAVRIKPKNIFIRGHYNGLNDFSSRFLYADSQLFQLFFIFNSQNRDYLYDNL
jgi:hypothetical protein